MVSTRGLRIKFAEGEKVLCYEPDPAKTKVLYDSKVLNIKYKQDKYGKKEPHYLIHFQGWSSTWDRIVTEDLILKDTSENRVLQKDLASKAQLIARGGNLYRRERGTRRRSGGRSSLTNGSTMSQGSDSDASDGEDTRPIILLPLPPLLKRALEYDELVITTQNKVLNIPAEPNIISILESFLKDYAKKLMNQVCAKKQSTQSAKTNSSSMTVEDYCRNMNLCREVVDGVRLFVDFSLSQVLLYRQERGQFHEAKTKGIQRQPKGIPNIKIKEEEEEEDDDDNYSPSSKRALLDIPPATPAPDSERRRTLRSSHAGAGTSSSTTSSATPGPSQPSTESGTRHSLRRLSHDVKLSEQNGNVVIKMEGVLISQREHEVLDKILSWSLVPDKVKEKKPPLPSVLYGATHLVRALIRLPELIQKADYSEAKTNLVMDFLNSILKYLDERGELFGEYQYVDNIYPPPPPATDTATKPE